MKNQKKVVIVGAGYAGINLVNKLSSKPNIEITLINKTSYHLHQTDIHKYISGKSDFETVAFDLKKYAKNKGIKFIETCVTDIKFDDKVVITTHDKSITYDFLAIATGSVSLFPSKIKNIEEYAQDIKDFTILKEQRKKFLNILKLEKKNKNITIVGGGLSGVEIALEFAQVLKERNISNDECTISLVEKLPDILPNMDSFLINKTGEMCDALNVKRYHGAFVSEVQNNTIYLSDSIEIPFDMVLFVIGVSSKKFVSDEKIEMNVKNQFVVDKYLRVIHHREVFALGDIAQTQDKNDNYVLPTAQMAKLHAVLCAKNILNSIEGKALIENDCTTKGVMIDLANKNTVGIIMGLKVKGFIAYFLKRFVSNQHTNLFK
jgi:NADH:ubiquinone reductase (H+-translocating)